MKGNLMTIAEMILLGAGDGKCVSVLGDKYTFKAAHKETGGAHALWEIATPATAAGPPAHVHERGDKAFYVLEGELTFQIGERTVHATAPSASTA